MQHFCRSLSVGGSERSLALFQVVFGEWEAGEQIVRYHKGRVAVWGRFYNRCQIESCVLCFM